MSRAQEITLGAMALNYNDPWEYIGTSLEAAKQYIYDVAPTMRLGQFWFNRLEPEDQSKLRGSLYDPFYKEQNEAVIMALAYLLLF